MLKRFSTIIRRPGTADCLLAAVTVGFLIAIAFNRQYILDVLFDFWFGLFINVILKSLLFFLFVVLGVVLIRALSALLRKYR